MIAEVLRMFYRWMQRKVKRPRPRRKNVESTGMSPVTKKTRDTHKPSQSTVPNFRKTTEGGKFTTIDGVYLLTSSHVHQRSPQFSDGQNQQRVVISLCALVTALRSKVDLTPCDLDTIIYSGHAQFLEYRQKCLSSVDLPSHFSVGGKSFPLEYSLAFKGLYSDRGRNDEFTRNLVHVLQNCGNVTPHGFVVMGHLRCVAFWSCANGKFLVFNSHCVNANNETVASSKHGAARLFECHTPSALARLVFKNDIIDGDTWLVLRVTVKETNMNGRFLFWNKKVSPSAKLKTSYFPDRLRGARNGHLWTRKDLL